jgi:hypothetical protein
MSSYVVEFTAYLDVHKKPDGFPPFVQIIESYDDVQSTEHLKLIVNTRVTSLATAPGLIVFKKPTEIIESGHITFDKRRFVPWHMITHMEMRVELIPEPIRNAPDAMIPIDRTPAEKKEKETVN